jgi:hypothetical protein
MDFEVVVGWVVLIIAAGLLSRSNLLVGPLVVRLVGSSRSTSDPRCAPPRLPLSPHEAIEALLGWFCGFVGVGLVLDAPWGSALALVLGFPLAVVGLGRSRVSRCALGARYLAVFWALLETAAGLGALGVGIAGL